MKDKKIIYVEPAEYFPKEIRKKFGLGEYADENKKETNNDSAIEEKDN